MIWLLLAVAQAAPLVRQPYLQRTTPTETTVAWSTLYADGGGEVRYGPSPTQLTQSVSVPGGTHHEARITGLAPDTTTFYAVYSDGSAVATGSELWVHTPPVAGARDKVRMWVVGDSGTGLPRQYAVRDAMLEYVGRDGPDLFLHVGDMAYTDGTWLQFTTNFFLPYADLLGHTTVWPALGNHEGKSADSATQSGPYYDAYVLPTGGEAGGVPSGTEAYYSFDHANAHVIVLDSHDSDRSPTGAMATWLQADLAATDAEWVIATWHHPPYTKGSHDSDAETQLVEMREHILPILEAGGVDLVFTGHSHIYERSYLLDGAYETPSTSAGILDADDGVPGGDGPYAKAGGGVAHDGAIYVVAGHGGTDVKGPGGHPLMAVTEKANGSVIVDLHENRIDLVNVRSDGEVTDRVALVKGEGLVVIGPNGGEGLLPGSTVPITWETVGDTETVDVAWSCDDGATWTPIATVADTGRYDWTIPDHHTADVLVRVSDADDPAVRDESNARLSIGGAGVDAIPWGSEWAYLDSGAEPPDDWLEPGFDDSAWSRGPAQLGYGEGDEATTLHDADPNVASVYFRKVVHLDDPVDGARLSLLYDDGAIVWVNGYEVLRENVLFESHGSYTLSTSRDNARATEELSYAPFEQGPNVIGVMIKQASEDSSDLSFDLRLQVDLDSDAPACPPPPVTDTGDTASPDTGGDTAADTGPAPGDTDDGAVDADPGGCGCATGTPAGPVAWLLGLGLVLRRRQR